MQLKILSYTKRDGTQDTTVNDGVNYSARIKAANTDITAEGVPVWTPRSDGQEDTLAGVKIKGRVLEISLTIQGTLGVGLTYLGGMFDPHDTSTKTIIFQDVADSNRLWYLTGRNGKLGQHTGGGNVIARFICKSSILLTSLTRTETTWPITASAQTQAFTNDLGNIDAFPIYELTPTSARGYGQRYRHFVTTYNYTKKSANQYHICITGASGLDTSALIKVTTTNTTSTMAGITASVPATGGTLTNLASTASFPASGVVMYGTEQISYTSKTATTFVGITRAAGGTTAASHANPTTVYLSQMYANGSDVRVLLADGNGNISEVPYWFGDTGLTQINQTNTLIWIPLNYAVRALGLLAGSITDSDTSLSVTQLEGNFDLTDGLLLVDSEICSYTSFDPFTNTFVNLTRPSKGTANVAHTANTTVRGINELWLYYGNPLATAPNYPQALKPPFSLGSSLNSLWVYTNFASSAQNTNDEFKPSKIGARALTYSSDRDINNVAPADPVVELGLSVIDKDDTAQWDVAIAFGWTQATFTNIDAYNLPASTGWMKAGNGTQVAIAKTTAANTWQTTSPTITPAITAFSLTLYAKNSTTANFGTRAAMNAAQVAISLSAGTGPTEGVPYASLGAQQLVTYDLDAIIENTTTNENIRVVFDNMALNSTIRIDTFLRATTYLGDNRRADNAIYPYPSRENILKFRYGVANTYKYTELGATGVNFVLKWQGRCNALG